MISVNGTGFSALRPKAMAGQAFRLCGRVKRTSLAAAIIALVLVAAAAATTPPVSGTLS